MDFGLTQEQEMLKTMARDFLTAECTEELIRKIDRGSKGYSPNLWKKIADLGWQGFAFPEKYGGADGNLIDLAVLHEEMGRAMFPSPFLSTVVLGGKLIEMAGTEDQKKKIITGIAKGDIILSLAFSEPQSVWDGTELLPEGITVTAEPQGNDFVINGTKLFVHDAHVANHILVVARTGKKPEDITVFMVDAKAPGITTTLLAHTAGDNKQSEVVFKNVKVSKDVIVGGLNKGWAPVSRVIRIGAIMLCTELVGAAQRCTDTAVDYAKTRLQFELPIGINQFIQEHAVEMVAGMDTSRWMAYYAAWMLNENISCELEVATAKAWCAEKLETTIWKSHDIQAGVACVTNSGVMPLLAQKAAIPETYLGTADFWREVIVDELEKLPPPEKAKGKPLGIWDPKKEQWPTWDTWQDYVKSVRKLPD